jgi:hypothetical protein
VKEFLCVCMCVYVYINMCVLVSDSVCACAPVCAYVRSRLRVVLCVRAYRVRERQ